MTWRVPLSDLDYGIEELDAVREVLHSKWLTMGEVTERFERAFAKYLGVRHAIAVANGTAGLHLANLALGIGPGDEVIVPSLTFVATANSVRYTGAMPIFADIVSEEDLGISPEAIREVITENTKAIMIMHYAGYPCDIPSILELAKEYSLAVIEDAAHATGAAFKGKKAGTFGDVGCFSFFSNKNLVTGEGGMIVTDRDELAESIRLLRSHGMTSLTWDRHQGHAHSYDVVALGYNYRTDEIRSALGLAQLRKLDRNNERRRRITDRYRLELGQQKGFTLPYLLHEGVSSAHLFPILLEDGHDRRRFMDAMRDQGIQTSIHYPPVHGFSYSSEATEMPRLPITEDVASREVTLPLFPSMTDDHVGMVIDAVQTALSESSR